MPSSCYTRGLIDMDKLEKLEPDKMTDPEKLTVTKKLHYMEK